jgi:hypothetical protein
MIRETRVQVIHVYNTYSRVFSPTMTVVKSVSDGLGGCESETQLNLNRPLRISPGPRHLRLPLAAIST